MNPIRVAGPAVEPVSVAEMRLYLRLDDGSEDDLVTRLIQAARLAVEAEAGCVLVNQTWRLEAPLPLAAGRGGLVLALRPGPVLAVASVSITAPGGTETLLDPAAYALQPWVDPPRLVIVPEALVPEALAPGTAPAGTLRVAFEAGFGATPESVPEPLLQAIRMLVARWFESRGDGATLALPPDIARLVAPYRRRRLA